MSFVMESCWKFLHCPKLNRFILKSMVNWRHFHTSGGTSTLTKSFPNVETLEYKTIRYKGHAEKFQLLVDLGLLARDNEVTVDGR